MENIRKYQKISEIENTASLILRAYFLFAVTACFVFLAMTSEPAHSNSIAYKFHSVCSPQNIGITMRTDVDSEVDAVLANLNDMVSDNFDIDTVLDNINFNKLVTETDLGGLMEPEMNEQSDTILELNLELPYPKFEFSKVKKRQNYINKEGKSVADPRYHRLTTRKYHMKKDIAKNNVVASGRRDRMQLATYKHVLQLIAETHPEIFDTVNYTNIMSIGHTKEGIFTVVFPSDATIVDSLDLVDFMESPDAI